jgi:hypothetical protein
LGNVDGAHVIDALMGTLKKRRLHHVACMQSTSIDAAILLWRSNTKGPLDEAPVRVALDAERADIALSMLHTTTPLILAGVPDDSKSDVAAADADRICRRLSSHMALALHPRLVWHTILAWEAGGRHFRRNKAGRADTSGGLDNGRDTATTASAAARERGVREMRRAWRFLLRFRLVVFMGMLAKASSQKDLEQFWNTSAPQTRIHLVEIVLYHAERTLKLAERPHCQRMWARTVAAAAAFQKSLPTQNRNVAPSTANPNLLPLIRGAVASLRNVALWAASQD